MRAEGDSLQSSTAEDTTVCGKLVPKSTLGVHTERDGREMQAVSGNNCKQTIGRKRLGQCHSHTAG